MKRILIIDDNPDNNEDYIMPVCKKYSVEVVMFLRSAERKLMHTHYDLIVIDIMMPSQNLKNSDEMRTGLSFYEEFILKNSISSKILFWSRLPEEVFKDYTKNKKGMLDFVQKTSDTDHLLRKVETLIG